MTLDTVFSLLVMGALQNNEVGVRCRTMRWVCAKIQMSLWTVALSLRSAVLSTPFDYCASQLSHPCL